VNPKLKLALHACVVALALCAAWLASNSTSFSLDNKAVYRGF
jgi:hypothetical protein